jgi:K+-sensing histidine kinase KdpD
VERLYYQLQDSFERSSQAKALKQSERLKSALLDAVTHDFRTPLTSIKASATAMLADLQTSERNNAPLQLGNEDRKEMLQVIDEEADRLDRFVEGLTKLARIDAGDMRLNLEPASVEEIVTTALKLAEPRTRTHRMEVWIDDLPLVTVDEHAVSESIYTLIDNAAKYSPPESAITVRAAQKDDSSIVISVEDRGPGVRPDLRERVFEKFFRAMRDGDVTDGRIAGSGMGLAIARGIVEAHHGRIWVEAGEGGNGAKFMIELPINK